MLKLPSPGQSFDDIRKNDYLYVDKTEYIYYLLEENHPCLLARPPLFGKGTFVSALLALFAEKRELFKGLWIDESDYGFCPRARVHLNFKNLEAQSIESLNLSLLGQIGDKIKALGRAPIEEKDPILGLDRLLNAVYNESLQEPIAVVVEGYDAIILKLMAKDPALAESAWESLRAFYAKICLSEYTDLVLFTGESRLDFGEGDFGPLVTDLTFDPRFAAAFGFTEEEYKTHFHTRFNGTLNRLIDDRDFKPEATAADLKETLDSIYGNHTWNGEDFLLNPHSTIEFFRGMKFDAPWFQKTSPDLLEYLSKSPPDVVNLLSKEVGLGSLSKFHQVRDLTPKLMMFQGGLLGWNRYVSKDIGNRVKLYFPNLEVRYSLLPRLLKTSPPQLPMLQIQALGQSFQKALYKGDAEDTESDYRMISTVCPLRAGEDIFERGINLVLFLLAVSGQSLKGLYMPPFELALSSHEFEEREYDGDYVLIGFKFLKTPEEIAAVKEERYPEDKFKAAVRKNLCPTLNLNDLGLSTCVIVFTPSEDEIKVIFQKL
jgi:hypothetical protein